MNSFYKKIFALILFIFFLKLFERIGPVDIMKSSENESFLFSSISEETTLLAPPKSEKNNMSNFH